jgi:hypothetical protein
MVAMTVNYQKSWGQCYIFLISQKYLGNVETIYWYFMTKLYRGIGFHEKRHFFVKRGENRQNSDHSISPRKRLPYWITSSMQWVPWQKTTYVLYVHTWNCCMHLHTWNCCMHVHTWNCMHVHTWNCETGAKLCNWCSRSNTVDSGATYVSMSTAKLPIVKLSTFQNPFYITDPAWQSTAGVRR